MTEKEKEEDAHEEHFIPKHIRENVGNVTGFSPCCGKLYSRCRCEELSDNE